MSNYHQHGLDRSMLINIREYLPDVRVDLKFDKYVMPEERPLILVEQMPANNRILTKGREAIESIYRYQVGLFDDNSINLSITQEKLQEIFLFDDFIYYDSLNDYAKCGLFDVELTSLTPLYSSELTEVSSYNRVYYDLEIQTIKRRWT